MPFSGSAQDKQVLILEGGGKLWAFWFFQLYLNVRNDQVFLFFMVQLQYFLKDDIIITISRMFSNFWRKR